jgi:hypothetical protein
MNIWVTMLNTQTKQIRFSVQITIQIQSKLTVQQRDYTDITLLFMIYIDSLSNDVLQYMSSSDSEQ